MGMKDSKLGLVLLSMAVAFTSLAVHAQAEILVQAHPSALSLFAPSEPALAKLAPELRLAVTSRSRFVGFGTEGRALLSFADSTGHQTVLNTLSASGAQHIAPLPQDEVARLTARRPQDIERETIDTPVRIDEIIVLTGAVPSAATSEFGGYVISERSEELEFVTIQKFDGFSQEEILELAQRPDTQFIEPNYQLRLFASEPNDPHFVEGRQWGLKAAGFPEAWEAGLPKSDAVVAVVDTGLFYVHEDLAANMWRNGNEIADGTDTDGNGFIDDINGYDFVDDDGDPLPNPLMTHATQVAGIVGAVGDNAKHMTGGAWEVRLMAIRTFGGPNGSVDAAAKGIDYAVDNGADIINISWGTTFGQEPKILRKAIQKADDNGVLVVAAAGNLGWDIDGIQPVYPVGYANTNIIGVSAHASNDKLWRGTGRNASNFGATSVDLAAPGEAILSLLPSAAMPIDTIDDGNDDGTSLAAPHVSAAAAILWSQIKAQNPDLKKSEITRRVRGALLRNSRPSPALAFLVATGGSLDLRFLVSDDQTVGISDAPTSVSGRLIIPTVSIGAVGGGAIIETDEGTVEIDLQHNKQFADYLEALNGETVTLQGSWATLEKAPLGEINVFIPETNLDR